MDHSATQPFPEGNIFAQLVAELEEAKDPTAVLTAYCERHPDLAAEFREKARMMQALQRLRPAETENWPRRLGELEVVRRVTAGGMGDVFEAVQTSLGRRVAVKTIRRGRISPLAQARFLREQAILASLHQTHIVSIHTAGTEGSLQYFAMPFIEGATLQQLTQSARQFSSSTGGNKTPSLAEMAALVSTEHEPLATAKLPSGRPAAARAAARPAAPARITLSQAYFRSVAQVIIDAAEALQHAHDVHILHRDMKPSNLMVDTSGQCWIIDFGLAASVDRTWQEQPDVDADVGLEALTGSGILGTPHYMAPEQWEKNRQLDARADVWGLGVTLYELLTLRLAFQGSDLAELKSRIASREPPPPRSIVANVPGDLEAVCLKAIRKQPSHRYQTAQALADDLRRWTRREPTTARGGVARRVGLWAVRNKGWAAAIVLAMLAVTSLVAAEIQTERGEVKAAEAREQENKRDEIAQKLQLQLVNTPQTSPDRGWRDAAWQLVREAAKIRKDDQLRDQAASVLIGIDATCLPNIGRFSASSVAIDGEGKRLLTGGVESDSSTSDKRPTGARLWDVATSTHRESPHVGPGPVAFRADGVPLQLVVDRKDRTKLLLWDIAGEKLIRGFQLPPEDGATPRAAAGTGAVDTLLAMTADGAFAAARCETAGRKQALLVWNVASGKLLRRIEEPGTTITALAIAPDGGQLAIGSAEGEVAAWPIPAGDRQTMPTVGRTDVNCLAFGRSAVSSSFRLLASGNFGGGLVIWDLDRRVPQAFCRGTEFDVAAVAFSPDGVTLASAGRGPLRLWDTATGRPLLELKSRDFRTGLAFSPDGRRLAVSSETVFGLPGADAEGGVQIWNFQPERGIKTLRGLAAPVARVCLSADGSRLAALSHDWQVAIWNMQTGFIERLLNVPKGNVADNAGMAFSRDGRRFAYSAGTEARLWNLQTGREQSWRLPPAVVESLVFDAAGKNLLLFRSEEKHPVCRVRNLFGARPEKPLWETDQFTGRVKSAELSADGLYLVVGGSRGPADREERSVKIFEAMSGHELWSLSGAGGHQSDVYCLDPTGRTLAVDPRGTGGADLVQVPTGRLLGSIANIPHFMAPDAAYWAGYVNEPRDCALYLRADSAPVVAIHCSAYSQVSQFSADSQLAIWGNADGSVSVCDIQELRRELATIGLGW